MKATDGGNMKKSFAIHLIISALCGHANSQTQDIAYQGRLVDGSAAASGNYDFLFRLFDNDEDPAAPQIGPDQTRDDVLLTAGVFTVVLNFGAAAFDGGGQRYLEIWVRPGGSVGAYTKLTPRQRVTSSPFSLRASKANSADSLTSSCAMCVTNNQILSIDGSKVTGPVSTATNVSGIVQISNGGTGSSTQNFVDLSNSQTIGGNKTFANGLSITGNVSVTGGVNLSSRVVRTGSMTGTTFVNNTLSGNNVCPATFHAMTAWEAMVVDVLAPNVIFDMQGWVIGSFPNIDAHMRSLTNGNDSVVCPAGSHLTKYPSLFQHGNVITTGGLHCAPDTASMPVWCIRNKGF
jgi:hypothetical protein